MPPISSAALLRQSSQTSLAERRLLLDCLDQLPDGARIVELGTARGGTTRILAEYAADRDMHVTTVDLQPDSTLRESLSALGVRAIFGSSCDPHSYWPRDERVDLIVIDADHSWFGVRADWEAWRPLLREGAFVLFHDVSPCCPGEFVYVCDRIFHGEMADVRTQDTLTGGRYTGVVAGRDLTARGRNLLTNTIEAPLRLWPREIRDGTNAKDRRFGARPVDGTLATAQTFAILGLEPTGAENVPVVGAVGSTMHHDLVSVDRHVREALPIRLLHDGDDRLFELFADELRTPIRDVVSTWSDEDREFLGRAGALGRCPLLDFVDPTTVTRFVTEHERAIVVPNAASMPSPIEPPVDEPCFR